MNEFEKDLVIDPEQLDVMAGMQGELFFKWAEKSVEARKEVDHAKFALEVLVASLSSRVRKDPGAFGLTKVTEGSVDGAVKISAEYREEYEVWLEAKAQSALMDKATEAMEQRKRMIEVLTTLHGQQYFAGPSVPRSLVSAWKEQEAKRSETVRKKTKIRRRTVSKADNDG